MALLVVGSVAALTGTAVYVAKKSSRSRYRTFVGDEDPRIDFDTCAESPERVKSLTKYYSVDFPDILVGWRVKLADGRVGTVVNFKRRFLRATVFEIAFEGKARAEPILLNRKNKANRRKYIDFELLQRDF
jgi:hypothetical protein